MSIKQKQIIKIIDKGNTYDFIIEGEEAMVISKDNQEDVNTLLTMMNEFVDQKTIIDEKMMLPTTDVDGISSYVVVAKDGDVLITDLYNDELINKVKDKIFNEKAKQSPKKKGIKNIVIAAGAIVLIGVTIFTLSKLGKYNNKNGKMDTSSPTPTYSTTQQLIEAEEKSQNLFDAEKDVDKVSQIVATLKQQVEKEKGVNVDSSKLTKMLLLANGVKLDKLDIFEEIILPLANISNIDTVAATNAISGVEKITDERTIVELDKIFADKQDNAFVKAFADKQKALLDAIYQGKDKNEIDKLINDYFETECRVLIDEESIKTTEGEIKLDSVSDLAKVVVLFNALSTDAVIAGRSNNYSITIDMVNDVSGSEKETFTVRKVSKTINESMEAVIRNIALPYEQKTVASSEDCTSKVLNK